VAVGMSGGVDSSVAALLCVRSGYDVVGVTMKVYGGGISGCGPAGACYGPDEGKDAEDAAAVCASLGIAFKEIDLRKEYEARVLSYFRTEYLSGRTPNPCVRCNQTVKFGALFDAIVTSMGEVDRFATGHYARVDFDRVSGRYILKKGVDAEKDQSYFLCMLSQAQLGRSLFPLGGMKKEEVRRLARENGLAVHDKAESQDFAGGDYRSLIEPGSTAGPRGSFVTSSGEVLGPHKGIWSYTIGQRRGLGIARGEPLYVTEIRPESDTVVVGPASELYRSNLRAEGVNWVSMVPPAAPLRAGVRIRYRHEEEAALVTPNADGSADVAFDKPQRSIAAGQWAVFYNEDMLLGGGMIQRSW
jgi:tRNA-uridine 2-sulfurtransferase